MAIRDRVASFLGISRESAKPFKEQGVSGVQIQSGYVVSAERNAALTGDNRWRTFDDIATNIPVVSASIRYFTALVTKAAWSAAPADADSMEAKEAAEFVQRAMDAIEQPWSQIVARAVTARFYGFSVQEWTAQRQDDGTVLFRSIENRPQSTVARWDIDESGTVIGIVQRGPDGREIYLPRGKAIYLVDSLLTDSPAGMGILRHCVESATRLKAYQVLEQRGYERDLRGIPIASAPFGAINDALASIEDDGSAEATAQRARIMAPLETLRRFVSLQIKGESTGLILDSTPWSSPSEAQREVFSSQKQWGVELLQGPAPGLAEIHTAKQELNYEIARLFGTEGMMLGQGGSGSLALSKDRTNNLILSANAIIEDVVDQFQKDFVGPLWALNGFPEEMKPQLAAERIDHRTVEEVAATLRDLATAGAILTPDDPAVGHVRGLMGVPVAEEAGTI